MSISSGYIRLFDREGRNAGSYIHTQHNHLNLKDNQLKKKTHLERENNNHKQGDIISSKHVYFWDNLLKGFFSKSKHTQREFHQLSTNPPQLQQVNVFDNLSYIKHKTEQIQLMIYSHKFTLLCSSLQMFMLIHGSNIHRSHSNSVIQRRVVSSALS